MNYKLTNREAQMIYWAAEDDQFRAKSYRLAHRELLKLLADDPYKNNNFRPVIDCDILGYWIGSEMAGFADHMAEYEDTTKRELDQYFNFAAKFAGYVDQTNKAFKVLTLLALEIGVWEDKMQDLAEKLDQNHPDALEALKFYQNHIINELSVKA